MHRDTKKNFVLLPIFILLILIYSLNASASNKLKVIASIFPLQDFARAVGGDRITVDLLLPPGADPHTWELKPSDILAILKADIFIYIGAGMEPWIDDVLKGVDHGSLIIIEASRGLDLIINKNGDTGHAEHLKYSKRNQKDQAYHDSHQPIEVGHRFSSSHLDEPIDPHIWLDLNNDKIIVDKIAKALSNKDPEGKGTYLSNANQYKEKLSVLDKKFMASLKGCRRREIVLGGHSAFAYMANRYGLVQIPLYGINPDSEPRPQEMATLIETAKKKGVKVVFFERLLNNQIAKVIAQEIDATTLVLNPGSNLTKKERQEGLSFIRIMEKNLINLKRGLECD